MRNLNKFALLGISLVTATASLNGCAKPQPVEVNPVQIEQPVEPQKELTEAEIEAQTYKLVDNAETEEKTDEEFCEELGLYSEGYKEEVKTVTSQSVQQQTPSVTKPDEEVNTYTDLGLSPLYDGGVWHHDEGGDFMYDLEGQKCYRNPMIDLQEGRKLE